MTTHKHQCGLTMHGYDPEHGCGHIWEHTGPTEEMTQEEYDERHTCPACGNPKQKFRLEVVDRYLSGERKSLVEELIDDIMLMAIIKRVTKREDLQSDIQKLFGK